QLIGPSDARNQRGGEAGGQRSCVHDRGAPWRRVSKTEKSQRPGHCPDAGTVGGDYFTLSARIVMSCFKSFRSMTCPSLPPSLMNRVCSCQTKRRALPLSGTFLISYLPFLSVIAARGCGSTQAEPDIQLWMSQAMWIGPLEIS